jgi:hypothetical protein
MWVTLTVARINEHDRNREIENYGTVWLESPKSSGMKSPPNDAPIGHPPRTTLHEHVDAFKNIIGHQIKELLVFF